MKYLMAAGLEGVITLDKQIEITREMLESYRSKKEEIKELKYKLEHLCDGDSMVDNDVVFDYRSGYPRPQAIVGVDWEKVTRTEERYLKRIEKLKQECENIEEFVEQIEDSLIRRIFRMYYLEGKSQKAIGKIVHMDRSNISRKIDNFFKVAHNSHNAHL